MDNLLNPAVLIFLIPIVAILGSFITKWKKMDLERSQQSLNDEMAESILMEITRLRKRVETLETIVASEEEGTNSTLNERREDEELHAPRLKNMLHNR